MVTLGECEAVPRTSSPTRDEDRYRVLDLDEAASTASACSRSTKGKDVLLSETLPADERQAADFIPFVIIGAAAATTRSTSRR
jgi:hypothetical protein